MRSDLRLHHRKLFLHYLQHHLSLLLLHCLCSLLRCCLLHYCLLRCCYRLLCFHILQTWMLPLLHIILCWWLFSSFENSSLFLDRKNCSFRTLFRVALCAIGCSMVRVYLRHILVSISTFYNKSDHFLAILHNIIFYFFFYFFKFDFCATVNYWFSVHFQFLYHLFMDILARFWYFLNQGFSCLFLCFGRISITLLQIHPHSRWSAGYSGNHCNHFAHFMWFPTISA